MECGHTSMPAALIHLFPLSGSNSSVERDISFFADESFGQTSQNVARRSRSALNYKAGERCENANFTRHSQRKLHLSYFNRNLHL